MSQSKCHKIQVKNRPGAEGQLTMGANTRILLDGKPLKCAQFFKFEVHCKKMAKVTIELLAEVEIEANVELNATDEETDLTNNGKPVPRYVLSSYSPVTVDIKEKKS